MKLIALLLGIQTAEKKLRRKTFAEHQQAILVKQGREQFKRLIEKNLSIPVAYL
ncbi:MAG: hypothetical protein RLZZ455_992 [Candidatus Parcubacteria bacterium]|jgi:hypothetical protein